jgi:hypothetical protein
MQVPLLFGIVASETAEFVPSYPLNLEPVVVASGISEGQLRSAVGAIPYATGPGVDRGGIEWKDVCYRAMGPYLVSVSAQKVITKLGTIGGDGPVRFDFSFDKLIIRSAKNLFYWDGTALTQVTDPDLGVVLDALWVDGYTMSTDGEYVLVTELNDPYQVKPLKYGSAEADPDPIVGLEKVRGEVYVLGTNTIQVLNNIGGNGFPFATVPGATIATGCVSASAKTLFGDTFAFVGSGRGDALGVYVAGSGTATKISSRVIDDALSREEDPAQILLERRVSRDELRLIVHLAKESWCFMAKASNAAGEPVWYRLGSGVGQPYRLRAPVMVYGRTLVGDTTSSQIGELSTDVSTHFGDAVEWSFDLGMIYNGAKGAIVDTIEMTGLPTRGDDSAGNTMFLSLTRDGATFTQERTISMGVRGQRTKRMQARPHFRIRNYMGMRFRGYNKALAGFAACEVNARPLTL